MEKSINAAEIARKHFGQNFLKDRSYIHRIIEAIPEDNFPIVEIGPGLGDLTSELIQVRNVTAFEVDKRLCEHLHDRYAFEINSNVLKLICGDVLEHWVQRSVLDTPYHVVANLPYYIATHLVLKALHDPMCRSILVMVQKEVAVKFAAQPGERNFSAPSVLASTAGEAKLCFEVPPEAFVPPPKVTSAVLSIRKKDTLEDPVFERFLKVAFAQPRKKLIKNLERVLSKEAIDSAFDALGIKNLLRPHEATTTIYHHLYTILKKDFINGQKHSSPNRRKYRDSKPASPT